MPAIEIQNISKSFGGTVALRDVSLKIGSGDFFGLLGPNGAGKTTLMRVLAGLLDSDAGQVAVLGRPLRRWEFPPEIGVVPQDIALYDILSARSNLELFGKLRGLGGSDLSARVDRALSLVGLSARGKSTIKSYSGGMKRRLNLAVALLHDPKILLLDEPTVGVDPQSRAGIFDLLEELHSRGVTIVYTTHYMEEAERLCRRIAILDHGSMLAEGTLEELLQKVRTPRFVRLLLRSEDISPPVVESVELVRKGLQADYLPVHDDGVNRVLANVAAFDGAQRVEIVSPNLETLFLELTGRELRDA